MIVQSYLLFYNRKKISWKQASLKEMVRLKSRNIKNYKLPEINCLCNCNLYLSSLLFWICLCYRVQLRDRKLWLFSHDICFICCAKPNEQLLGMCVSPVCSLWDKTTCSVGLLFREKNCLVITRCFYLICLINLRKYLQLFCSVGI